MAGPSGVSHIPMGSSAHKNKGGDMYVADLRRTTSGPRPHANRASLDRRYRHVMQQAAHKKTNKVLHFISPLHAQQSHLSVQDSGEKYSSLGYIPNSTSSTSAANQQQADFPVGSPPGTLRTYCKLDLSGRGTTVKGRCFAACLTRLRKD